MNSTRPAVCLLLAFSFASLTRADENGQLDANPTLFTVMAAINAAGYDADVSSTSNHPIRQAMRQYLAGRNIPSLPELKTFFRNHKQANAAAEFSQYVSFALSVGDPPDFKYRVSAPELPPDVLPLAGLDEILQRFYREAELEKAWTQSQPYFEKMAAAYQGPVTQALMQANAYLRNPTSGYLGHRFQVYVDLLGAPNQIQTRQYKDDYFVVVTPSAAPQTDEVRHAYLHYLLDPLVAKYTELISKKRSLSDYAQGAPALEAMYKEDFGLLATECVIKAVESRLERGAKREEYVNQALREGFVLTAAFAEQMPTYEKQEQAFRLYYPQMIEGIDLRKEVRRLDGIQFARERSSKVVKGPSPSTPPPLTGVDKVLEDAENQYRDRQLEPARRAYMRALELTDAKPAHAKAYYGLARIAALEKDPDLAQKLFEKTLESSPDADVRAWALVYLGRLADARSDRATAAGHYKAALAVAGATDGAKKAAEKGLAESFTRPKP